MYYAVSDWEWMSIHRSKVRKKVWPLLGEVKGEARHDSKNIRATFAKIILYSKRQNLNWCSLMIFQCMPNFFSEKTSKKRSIHEVSKRWTKLQENVHFPFWFYQFPRRWLQTWFIKGNYTYSKNQYHVSLFQQVAKNLHLYLISRKIP